MVDLPILFSAPMIRAKREGRKRMTRRVLGRLRIAATPDSAAYTLTGDGAARALLDAADFRNIESNLWAWSAKAFDHQAPAERTRWLARIPYAIDDRLWVREAWRTEARYDGRSPRDIPPIAIVSYEADYDRDPNDGCRGRYRHARFMPRVFSRLTLLAESVKVERLQDISEEDAIAEGAEQYSSSTKLSRPFNPDWKGIYREGFAELWNSINGPDAWDANPWVAAIGFSVIHQNIDAIEPAQRETA